MIGGLFVALALSLFGVLVLAQGGLWGIALFGLALLTGISGMADAA